MVRADDEILTVPGGRTIVHTVRIVDNEYFFYDDLAKHTGKLFWFRYI